MTETSTSRSSSSTAAVVVPPNVAAVSLFGPADAYLRTVESAFPDVDLVARGNEITFTLGKGRHVNASDCARILLGGRSDLHSTCQQHFPETPRDTRCGKADRGAYGGNMPGFKEVFRPGS